MARAFGGLLLAAAMVMTGLAGCPKKESSAKPVTPYVADQKVCPVSGEPIDKSFYVDYKAKGDSEAKRVYFCCKSCPAAFNKEPAKYLAKLGEQAGRPATRPDEGEGHAGHQHG